MNVITPTPASRRVFLRYAGATALSATVLLEACKNDDTTTTPTPTAAAVNLGSGDFGILNYAYALEQLEAAFYTQVIMTPFTGITDAERAILTDLRDHEIVHREFLKTALGTNAIPGLTVNFQSINFTDRASVLNTARTFEDLGIAAYNGAGRLIKDVNYLLVAGKIVSVEARHAAAIRDLLSPKTAAFAGDDVVTVANGLDGALLPAAVLPLVQPFVVNAISGANLPTA
ncbi:MAG: ferritin-like domain-containing protein [Bacteroidetes bacterium]|nr:ferritin-like domain-containing protein [Fibrella sp.]